MMSSTLSSILTLGLAGWLSGLLTLGFLIVCVVMILIVLIQRPQGGGLSGAFGSGAGSGQTAFGAKTGDALTFATIGIFVLFLVSAVGLNFAARPSEAQPAQEQLVAPEGEAEAPGAETGMSAGDDDIDSTDAGEPAETEGESDAADPGEPAEASETDSSVEDTASGDGQG